MQNFIKVLVVFFISTTYSLQGFSQKQQEKDEHIKEKILNQYGDRSQYNSVLNDQREKEIKRKLKTIQNKMKEPLIKDPDYFEKLNPIEKQKYIERREKEQEIMSAYYLKHHKLLEEEDQARYQAELKKKELKQGLSNRDNIEAALKDFKEFSGEELNKNSLTNLMGGDSKKLAAEMMAANPFSKMSAKEVRERFEYSMEGKPLGKLFKKFPNLLTVGVELARHETAVPKLIEIVNYPDKLVKYSFACIFIFVVGFIINMKVAPEGVLKKILLKVFVSFGSLSLNLYVFYSMFYEQVSPTMNIIKMNI